MQGKIFQHTTPTGPYLVVPGAVEDAADLEIRCEVDGQVMQQARTSDLLFSPADIISYASRAITLRPGGLIATGTCGGIGDSPKPPVYLRPGNMLRTWIEGLGECVNYCVAENSLGSTRKRTWNADYTCFQFEFDSGVAFVSINHLPINLLDDVLLVEAHQADYMSKFSPIE